MSSYCNRLKEQNGLLLTHLLSLEGFGVVGLLLFGVVGLLDFGVVGLLDRDPLRKSGNLCGETVLFSIVHVMVEI